MSVIDELLSEDPKAELIELISDRLSTVKRKIGEIKSQVEQTNKIVEREQTRNTNLATDIQHIQNNLATIPRDDIRDTYNDALDVRSRLATMRGQLEKLQGQYEQLDEEQELLTQLFSAFKIVNLDDAGGDDEGFINEAKGPANIVRIIQVQEEERQRLARQMHDGPAQSLTNFVLQSEICQRLFDRDPERAAEELSSLKDVANVTFQKVRAFIFDLRPMMLDDLGVIPTVRRYVDSFKEKNDIEVEFDVSGSERRLESHREVMIFRGIQELMGYARDSAGAPYIKVNLDAGETTVKITVHDNGRPFDAEALFEEDGGHLEDARSQGLITLKEKFELVGGTMSAHSGEDGTHIRLELPAR
jgi:two-component system, NarL family, sensor histidine kinase DegS